ncbi:MAG: hypothetical protein ACJA0V_001659 [Planctomycetota bacterium]|jgi:hypothetical protein
MRLVVLPQNMTNPIRSTFLLASFLLIAASATGQWSATAATNLAIGDGAGDQVQTKVAPLPDGGCYISWYDSDPSGSPAFGYDVRVQRLDAGGIELWAHRGVLVADRGFSSTQDYDLDVDVAGNAILVFRDDRFTGIQITAASVDGNGNLLWGANGVQLTSTTNFVAAPKICGTTDGFVVVAWLENSDARVQRLDLAGTPQWATDVVLSIAGFNVAPSDLHESDAGSAIVALQRGGGFTTPRFLYAQKLDTAGGLLWGAGHVAVYDTGSLQFGNFPTFVPDSNGGAVFSWYGTNPALECFAQHLNAAGVEQFVHNGVSVANGAADRTGPAVAFDAGTQTTFVTYNEISGPNYRVGAQAFDATGNRLWGSGGVAVTNYGAAATSDVRALSIDGGVMALWAEEPGFAQDRLFASRLDAAGSTVLVPTLLSSTPAVKYRLDAALSSLGYVIVAWQDEGSGTSDVLAQNVLPNGTLGGVASAISRNGTGINPVIYTTSERPAVGQTWTGQIAHAPTALFTAALFDLVPLNGPVVPGIGEVLVAFPSAFLSVQVATGASDDHALTLPADLVFVGTLIYTQALVLDGVGFALGNALDLTVGL